MVLVTASFEASQEWMWRGARGSLMEVVTEALDLAQIGSTSSNGVSLKRQSDPNS